MKQPKISPGHPDKSENEQRRKSIVVQIESFFHLDSNNNRNDISESEDGLSDDDDDEPDLHTHFFSSLNALVTNKMKESVPIHLTQVNGESQTEVLSKETKTLPEIQALLDEILYSIAPPPKVLLSNINNATNLFVNRQHRIFTKVDDANMKLAESVSSKITPITTSTMPFEQNQQSQQHSFSCTLDINEYPLKSRYKLLNQSLLKELTFRFNIEIKYDPQNKSLVRGKKFILVFEGSDKDAVQDARSEVRQLLKDDLVVNPQVEIRDLMKIAQDFEDQLHPVILTRLNAVVVSFGSVRAVVTHRDLFLIEQMPKSEGQTNAFLMKLPLGRSSTVSVGGGASPDRVLRKNNSIVKVERKSIFTFSNPPPLVPVPSNSPRPSLKSSMSSINLNLLINNLKTNAAESASKPSHSLSQKSPSPGFSHKSASRKHSRKPSMKKSGSSKDHRVPSLDTDRKGSDVVSLSVKSAGDGGSNRDEEEDEEDEDDDEEDDDFQDITSNSQEGPVEEETPFEQIVFDSIFDKFSTDFTDNVTSLHSDSHRIAHVYSTKPYLSAKDLETMHLLKNNLSSLTDRVDAHKACLTELINDDYRMALMNLKTAEENPALFRVSKASSSFAGSEGEGHGSVSSLSLSPEMFESSRPIEILLYSHLMNIHQMEKVLEIIRVKLEHAEDTVKLKSETTANKVLTVNTVITILACGIAFGSYVAGLFGMNLDNTEYLQTTPHIFAIVCGGTFFCIVAFTFLAWRYMKAEDNPQHSPPTPPTPASAPAQPSPSGTPLKKRTSSMDK